MNGEDWLGLTSRFYHEDVKLDKTPNPSPHLSWKVITIEERVNYVSEYYVIVLLSLDLQCADTETVGIKRFNSLNSLNY